MRKRLANCDYEIFMSLLRELDALVSQMRVARAYFSDAKRANLWEA